MGRIPEPCVPTAPDREPMSCTLPLRSPSHYEQWHDAWRDFSWPARPYSLPSEPREGDLELYRAPERARGPKRERWCRADRGAWYQAQAVGPGYQRDHYLQRRQRQPSPQAQARPTAERKVGIARTSEGALPPEALGLIVLWRLPKR